MRRREILNLVLFIKRIQIKFKYYEWIWKFIEGSNRHINSDGLLWIYFQNTKYITSWNVPLFVFLQL